MVKYKIAKIEKKLLGVKNYSEFDALSSVLDSLEGNLEWKQNDDSAHYDYVRIRKTCLLFKRLREEKDIKGLMHLLRQDLVKNIGGIAAP